MSNDLKRPILLRLTSHWITMLGLVFVTIAGFSWLFVLPIQVHSHTNNSYIGMVLFIFIPVIFVFGLVLMAFGVFLLSPAHLGCRERTAGRRGSKSDDPETCNFLCCDQCRQHCDRDPRYLSRRGAYGNRAVLRVELPHHETRIHHPPELPPANVACVECHDDAHRRWRSFRELRHPCP